MRPSRPRNLLIMLIVLALAALSRTRGRAMIAILISSSTPAVGDSGVDGVQGFITFTPVVQGY